MGHITQHNGSSSHRMKNYKRNKGGADIRGTRGAAGGAPKKAKEGAVIGARVVVGSYFSYQLNGSVG